MARFMRWSLIHTVVLMVVLAAASFMTWMHGDTDPARIHYVNYRGRTNIDFGFEQYLQTKRFPYTIVYHDAQRDPEKLKKILSDINADKNKDLVVTWGTTVTLGIFGKHTDGAPKVRDVPGVFTLVTDPVASEIIGPGKRNITGASHVAAMSRQFSAMMIYKPGKIGVLYTPTESNSVVTVRQLEQIGKQYNVEVMAVPFELKDGKPTSENTAKALAAMKVAGVIWLYLPPDSYLGTQAREVVLPLAHKLGVVSFASTEQLMQAGAAFGLVSEYYELGAVAGEQAYSILRDKVDPSNIPVTTVRRFRHQLNSRVLKQLQLEVLEELKPEILDVADK